MSYFLIDYLEQRIAACDQMIDTTTDAESRRIFETTRARYMRDLSALKREASDPVN